MVGPLSRPLNGLIGLWNRALGGVPTAAVDPVNIARATGYTPLLFIQGENDPWGSVDNVAHMALEAPGTVATLWVDAKTRFEGYQYPIEHPELITSFLADYLK
jgi:pimeloyl-ACP methyl ester carboxylesterase